MMTIESWFGQQFQLTQTEKEARLLDELDDLLRLHRSGCAGYDRFLRGIGWTATSCCRDLAALPYLPVGVFKQHDLCSVPAADVFRILSSSGTTGQRTSRIFIDRDAANLQVKALSSVMTTLLGPARLPMLIIDARSTVSQRDQVNARTAGVLGMMTFGRDHVFALQDDMTPDWNAISAFLDRHAGKPIFLFGFTFMIWRCLANTSHPVALDLSQATLVHGGGWKKLQDEAVDNNCFKQTLQTHFGLQQIHNFYGMIEQIGSIFLEDQDGWMHPPDFADFIIRDPQTWQPAAEGQPGVVECISILPRSYPGNVILTEDLGVWCAEDVRTGAWRGKRLRILGRVPRAELRGCSDVYAARNSV